MKNRNEKKKFDEMIANVSISGLKYLKQTKSQKLSHMRQQYRFREPNDLYKRNDILPEKVKELYSKYKGIQEQYTMIKKEIKHREQMYEGINDESKLRTLIDPREAHSISNFDLDNQEYRGYYNQDYSKASSTKIGED